MANELKDTNIKVNSGHPGWVKTELGGPKAPIEVEDSYKTSLRLATLNDDGPSGGLFHEDEEIPLQAIYFFINFTKKIIV